MRKVRRLCLLVPFVVMLVLADCWAAPIPGDIDPYEVTLYADGNYNSVIGTWKLSPDIRMLKVPKLDKIPHSILLGSKVGALLFTDYDFSSHYVTYNQSTQTPSAHATRWYLLSHLRFSNSSPQIDWPTSMTNMEGVPYTSPLERLSLIVHRKDIDDMLGVLLERGIDTQWDSLSGQFYPLPDDANQPEVIYQKIPSGRGPFKLTFVAGGASGSMSMGGGSPSIWHLGVTVASDNGRMLYLPDAKNLTSLYDLNKYGVGQISSILLQYKGPFNNKQAYTGVSAKANAPPTKSNPVANAPPSGPDNRYVSPAPAQPPTEARGAAARKDVLVSTGKAAAPTPAIPELSGPWNSSIGLVYNMAQKGSQFEWTVAKTNEKGQGTVSGTTLSASWQGPQGSGSGNGKITAVDLTGKATQIEWNNGVRFYR
jgi:hypothetical protein